MYTKTSEATAFHTRSANHSTKGSRTGVNLLGHDSDPVEEMSDWEKADSIIAHLRILEKEITSSPKNSKKRKDLGLRKYKLQCEISDLKARNKVKYPMTVERCFMDLCKEEMGPLAFRILLNRALSLAGEQR